MVDLYIILKEEESEQLKYFLKINNIYYEASSFFEDVYFYINAKVEQKNIINEFINRL